MIIRSSHRMQFKDDGQTLTVRQLRKEDSGVYTCVAENTLQRIIASTDLRVREPSNEISPFLFIFECFFLKLRHSFLDVCRI